MNPDPQKMNANKQPCLSPSFIRPQTSKQKPKNYERQKIMNTVNFNKKKKKGQDVNLFPSNG